MATIWKQQVVAPEIPLRLISKLEILSLFQPSDKQLMAFMEHTGSS
jgi:hypothetical protein